MNYKIAFWISIAGNVILVISVALFAYFKGGINAILADSVKRKRDKKESELKSLKLLKSISERLSRYINTLSMMIQNGSASINEQQFNQILDSYEKAKIELEKELINCPENVESKVKQLIQKSEDMMANIIKEKSKSGIMNRHLLNLYTTSTASVLNIVIATIDKTLKK